MRSQQKKKYKFKVVIFLYLTPFSLIDRCQ